MLESLFDAELDYQPGSTVCTMAPLARTTTGDGGQVRFQGRGYARLDGALALREGQFNEVTHHARYTAFIQQATPAA